MHREPDGLTTARPSRGVAVGERQRDLEELLFTLEICRRALPGETHPEHFDRLGRIERLVRRSFERR